jgi:O-acetyl-ADP-ribose deacetylase (regulator of RNase III)
MPDRSISERTAVFDGDITQLELDAIVNAANERLLPGAGVCGAIHRAAGPDLAKACAAIGRCPTGEARLTPGFDLYARYVIHTVGPVWHGGNKGEPELLASCYRNSLRLAAESDIQTIAFPALSTGIFGYPVEAAAKVAVDTTRKELERLSSIQRVVFCCFGAEPAKIYTRLLAG